jgi:signal transduction histidine kinase
LRTLSDGAFNAVARWPSIGAMAPTGGQLLSVDVEAGTEGRDVWVCVRDNGAGFGADVAEHLFEPFYRAHDKRFEGHGLGLSIVRRAVEGMGGITWAKSPSQGGAQLCFRLPDAAIDAAMPHHQHSENEALA